MQEGLDTGNAFSVGRALSGKIGTWSVVDLNKPNQRLYCSDPSDVPRIRRVLRDELKDDTPVFCLVDGKESYLGEVKKVEEDSGRFSRKEISDLIQTASGKEELIEVSDDDIVARLDECETPGSIAKYNESAELGKVFANSKELGLSIDYYTRRRKDGSEKHDFRYRKRDKEGVAGAWVSAAYVREAVAALDEYKSLLVEINKAKITSAVGASDGWGWLRGKLKRVSDIAGKYMTCVTQEAVKRYSSLRLERAGREIAAQKEHNRIERETTLQAFAVLSVSRHPKSLNSALDMAERYKLPDSIVTKLKNRVQEVMWDSYDRNGSKYPILPPPPKASYVGETRQVKRSSTPPPLPPRALLKKSAQGSDAHPDTGVYRNIVDESGSVRRERLPENETAAVVSRQDDKTPVPVSIYELAKLKQLRKETEKDADTCAA
jgi:hypothetical protein